MFFRKESGAGPVGRVNAFLQERLKGRAPVGLWGFCAELDFKGMRPEALRAWTLGQMARFLEAFSGMVLPVRCEVASGFGAKQPLTMALDAAAVDATLRQLLDQASEPPGWCQLSLGRGSAMHPAGTLDELGSFVVAHGTDEEAVLWVALDGRFFSDSSPAGTQRTLWEEHQPLLERSLRAWELACGVRLELIRTNCKALEVGPSGFTQPVPKSAWLASLAKDDVLDEASIPDLDLLM